MRRTQDRELTHGERLALLASMRFVAPLLLLAVACDDPSFDHPDAQPLGASCLELTNLAKPEHGVCKAGDTIVVGDDVYVGVDSKADATITCEGVPCDTKFDVVPLAAGTLTIHLALQSRVNSDHNDVVLPTLNVRALDRLDVACAGCTGVKVGDHVTVSATAILDGAPRSLAYVEYDQQSSGPFGPAQVGTAASAVIWDWANVQSGTYTMSLSLGGVSVSPSFTVP